MTDHIEDLTDAELEQMFGAARAEAPGPSEAFLRRIEADALRESALRHAPRQALARHARRGEFWAGIGRRAAQLIWPVGLSAATLAGVWFGAWADSNGLINPQTLVGSEVAYELAYQVPSLAGYLEGY